MPVDQYIEQHSDAISDHPMSESWFREWSYSTCEFQGFQPGTGKFSACQKEQIGKALDTAMTAGRAVSMAMAAPSGVVGARGGR